MDPHIFDVGKLENQALSLCRFVFWMFIALQGRGFGWFSYQ
jgi:hypothetical protein